MCCTSSRTCIRLRPRTWRRPVRAWPLALLRHLRGRFGWLPLPTSRRYSMACCPVMCMSSVPHHAFSCSTPRSRRPSPMCRRLCCTTCAFLWCLRANRRTRPRHGCRLSVRHWPHRHCPAWITNDRPSASSTRHSWHKPGGASMLPRKGGHCWPVATSTRHARSATRLPWWPTPCTRSCPLPSPSDMRWFRH